MRRMIDSLCNSPDVLATLLVQISFGDRYSINYQTPVGVFESFADAIEKTKDWLLSEVGDKTNG